MTIFVIKFWSTSCGICGRMSKYDTKVAEELGLGFISVQRSKEETYERFKYVAAQLYPDLRMGWPTYIIAEGDDLSKLKVIGQVKGGSDKGTFRRKIQDVINADNPTQQPAKELPNAHAWHRELAEPELDPELEGPPVLFGGEPQCDDPPHGNCPDPGSDSKDQFNWKDNPDTFEVNTCKTNSFLLPFSTGSCDAGNQKCSDGSDNVSYTPYYNNNGNWIKGNTVGGSNSDHKVPKELEAPGTYECYALAKCKNSHREEIPGTEGKICCGNSCLKSKKFKIKLKAPNDCGEGPVDPPDPIDPCKDVVCQPGQHCENGACVPDAPVDPCNPNPCGPDETCFNNGGSAACLPNDPCAGVICGDCEVCDGSGNCVSTCGPGQICEGGVCKDPDPVDPCAGVSCGDCEICVNGICESTCAPGQICEGGVCKDPPPVDPCDGVVCPDGQVCVNGICETVDPCDGVTCPPNEECVNGICVPIDPCKDVVCRADQVCNNGVCECPPGQIEIDGICQVPGCTSDGDCGPCEKCDNNQCVSTCRADQICDGNGVCICPPGTIEVNGVCTAGNCVDDSQCGDCESCVGNQCTNNCRADQVCVNDVCQCPPDTIEVNGICVAGNCIDDSQCGDCESCVGNQCTNNCRADQVCVNDVCQCPPDHVEANGLCVPGNCVDDSQCGDCESCVGNQCTNNCRADQVCIDDVCECPPGFIEANGQCVEMPPCCDPLTEIEVDGKCEPNPCWGVECPDGEICKDGNCVPDPCKDVECPDGEICVDGVCKTDPCYGIECPPGYICECGECIPDRCWECCEDMKQCSHDCEDCHECYEDNCYIDLRMKISGPDCWPQGAEIKLTGTCLHAKDEKVNFTWYKGPRDNGGVKIAEGLGVNNITATAPTNPNDCIVYELYGEIEALNCPVPYDTHKLCVCENFPECPPATSTGRREPKRKNEEVFGKTHQNPIEIFPNMIPSTLSFKGRI